MIHPITFKTNKDILVITHSESKNIIAEPRAILWFHRGDWGIIPIEIVKLKLEKGVNLILNWADAITIPWSTGEVMKDSATILRPTNEAVKEIAEAVAQLITDDERAVYCAALTILAQDIRRELVTSRCNGVAYDIASRLLSAHILTNKINVTRE